MISKLFKCCYVNISFTAETEKNNKTSVLNVNIIRKQGKFTTSAHRKPNISGV